MYPKMIMMLEIESAKGSVNNHIYRGAMAVWPFFTIRSLASDTDMLYVVLWDMVRYIKSMKYQH